MSSAQEVLPIERLLEHADWVKGLAYRLVSDAVRAEDLVQETWLRALERPPRHAGNARAWVGIGRSRLRDEASDAWFAVRPRTVAGRVLDAAGRPAADVEVSVQACCPKDPVVGASVCLPFEDGVYLPERSYCLEDIAAGRTPGDVLTDEAGRFRLDGLLAKEYAFSVGVGDRGQASPARYPAGTVEIEIVFGD